MVLVPSGSDLSVCGERGVFLMQVFPNATPVQGSITSLPRVLIVDDDAAIRKMLVDVLLLEGFSPEVARDGREALALLEADKYQVVLLDLMMPVMDGWELCRTLRERPTLREQFSLVLMSAGEKLEQAQDLGADGYLAKPFDVNQLLELLEPFVPEVRA
jgi:CheY-like chemotaxis protein